MVEPIEGYLVINNIESVCDKIFPNFVFTQVEKVCVFITLVEILMNQTDRAGTTKRQIKRTKLPKMGAPYQLQTNFISKKN